jgi:hypothetical protein
MKQSWFTQSPNVFPFINMSLLEDIEKISNNHKATILKFSIQYQLQYIGEIAERWNQRDLVKEPKDLTTLALGFSFCYSGQFLYDQKETFVKNAVRYLKEKWDPTTAVTVLFFASCQRIMEDVAELEKLTNMLFERSWNKEDERERAYVIALMSKIYAYEQNNNHFNAEKWKAFICNQIDALNVKFADPHEDYPVMLLLSEVYTDLDKPSAKEFKTRGMVRYLQSFHTLRAKEVDSYKANGISAVIGVNPRDIYVYNYILAIEHHDGVVQSITAPGSERITQNYLRTQFLSEQPLPQGFIQRLKKNKYSYKFLLDDLNNFKNVENLREFVSYAKDILLEDVKASHIALLKFGVVDEDTSKQIVRRLLEEPLKNNYLSSKSYNLIPKDDFVYLEGLKERFGLEFTPTQDYVTVCLDYGLLSIDDIDTLREKGVIKEAINYLYSKKTLPETLDFLEKVPVAYHEILLQKCGYFRQKLEGDTKKRFYELYLEALFYLEPNIYPKCLVELFRDKEFVELFSFTNEEIEKIEKTLIEQGFLTKSDAEELYRKYTPKEVLEKERIEKLRNELLSTSSMYSFRSTVRRNLIDIQKHSSLQKAVYERMVTLTPKDEYDLKEFLVLFFKLKAKGLLSEEEASRIEEKGLSLAKVASF